jgi:hypothetical protein
MIGITIRVAVYEHRVIAKHNSHPYLNHQFLEKTMNKLSQLKGKAMKFSRKVEGKILPPLLLWMLGVPGGICVILWIFFFRGK